MKLLVISHKEIWRDKSSPSGYSTIGGFPMQMKALSELFDSMKIIAMERSAVPPNGASWLVGKDLVVIGIPEPKGKNFIRKLSLVGWLLRYFDYLWKEITHAEVLHTPVPGDIGFIGLIIGLIQRKKIFVRHCGFWGRYTTFFDAVLGNLLIKISSLKNVIVFATGGGKTPPSLDAPNIKWIFSSSITSEEMKNFVTTKKRHNKDKIQLISVGRIVKDKNFQSVVSAMSILVKEKSIHYHLIGDGEYLSELKSLSDNYKLNDAITFHGNLAHYHVFECLQQADLFVFPSNSEGFPKAVLEAMACGLAVIASNVSVLPNLVTDDCGAILDVDDPKRLVEVILKLTSDKKKLIQMGLNGQKKVMDLTIENWGNTIKDELEPYWNVCLRVD